MTQMNFYSLVFLIININGDIEHMNLVDCDCRIVLLTFHVRLFTIDKTILLLHIYVVYYENNEPERKAAQKFTKDTSEYRNDDTYSINE